MTTTTTTTTTIIIIATTITLTISNDYNHDLRNTILRMFVNYIYNCNSYLN